MDVCERRACRIAREDGSSQYRTALPRPLAGQGRGVRELGLADPRRSGRDFAELLTKRGKSGGAQPMERPSRASGLLVLVKRRRTGMGGSEIVLRRATRTDAVPCMDFAQDETADGRSLRLPVVAEDHTRDFLAIEVRQRVRFRHLQRWLTSWPQCVSLQCPRGWATSQR